MANEALKKIHDELSGGRNMTTEYLRDLIDRAIFFAVEEARESPHHQFAEHQARLVKAKADKAEWELYLATEGQRVPSFVERDPETCAPILTAPEWAKPLAAGVDVSRGGPGTLRPTSECGIPADGEVAVSVSFDVADGSLVGMRIEPAPMPTAATGIAQSLLADQKAKRDERREREGRELAALLRAAEERGFQMGKQAAQHTIDEVSDSWGLLNAKIVLREAREKIRHMKMEG